MNEDGTITLFVTNEKLVNIAESAFHNGEPVVLNNADGTKRRCFVSSIAQMREGYKINFQPTAYYL